jgi:UDP-GlcNAc:undecaprenyl-phosphate GlcNAc-1-phosphate transferase
MLTLASFTLALVLTVWFSAFLLKVGPHWLIDLPAERKIHDRPVPRTGGLTIGIIFFLSIIIFDLHNQLWWYLLGGVILFVLGVLDDWKSIRWPIKLVVQLIVSFIIIFRFFEMIESVSFFNRTLNFSTIGLIAVFLIWFVGILNAVNLIDGMDGLAGGFMVLITVFAVIIGIFNEANFFLILNASLLGGLTGFLFFNRRPARYFMGDSGSLLLGYHVACLPLLYHQAMNGGAILQITPFLILSSFLIMDTTRVFFSRALRRQNPMNADTIHLHHLVLKETKSYVGTLIPIFVVTLITGIGAVLFFHYGFGFLAMQLFILILVVFVITPPVPFYVPLASRITKYITTLKTSRFSNKHLFRIRYLPLFGATYLICLGIKYYQLNIIEILNPILIIGLGALLLFTILGVQKDESYQMGLILLVLFQILMVFNSDPLTNFSNLNIVRLTCLIWMVIITSANYVENSRHFGFEYWSVIDLLVLLIFVGLVVLYLNDLEIALWKWTEVILFYYSLGLYVQHKQPRISLRFPGDISTG